MTPSSDERFEDTITRSARLRLFVPLAVTSIVAGGLIVNATAGSAATLPVVSLPSTVIGQVEGNAGTANVSVTASLNQAGTTPITVHYATANGTATTADLDYTATSGTITFAPGQTTQTITVPVVGDTKLEGYQRFTVKLSAPAGATLGHTAQIVEIRNDESPKLSVAAAPVAEGTPTHFVPKLLQAYYLPLSLTAQTSNRTAIAPADYTATTAPVSFAAGSKVAASLNVPTIADGIAEPKETYALTVSGSGVFAPFTKTAVINASTAIPTCNTGQAAPTSYEKVVVFSFENRRWTDVGGPGFAAMPYAHSLATSCSFFNTWAEANPGQNSATQYVSQGQGDTNHTVLNDCNPSVTCRSTADNIFRQARTAGKTAINYVEGATLPCSASGNAAKHIPALYYQGADDAANCTAQVRPYSEFNPASLPAFSFVTPTQCNDGHDCPNATVDLWMQQNIAPVIASADYQAGKVLIEIWYDEDSPVPNLYISPSAHPGPFTTTGIGYASTLKLWEDVLGFPCLANACTAADIRTVANI